MAHIAMSLRQREAFPPLSFIPARPVPGFPMNRVAFADGHGSRSSIDRGEKHIWGAVGTSVTLSLYLDQEDLWSRQIEKLDPSRSTRVENFSSLGAFESMNQMILEAAKRGERFEAFFIMSTLVYRQMPPETTEDLFEDSRRWRRADGQFPLSYHMLKSYLTTRRDWPENVKRRDGAREYLKNLPPDLVDEKIPPESALFINECFNYEFGRQACSPRYFEEVNSGRMTDKQAWEQVFVPCQTSVEKFCYVPKRSSKLENSFLNKQRLYRYHLQILYDNASKISDRVYILTQPLNTDPAAKPSSLVRNQGTGVLSLEVYGLRHLMLDNETGLRHLELRNAEVKEAIQQLKLPLIDLNEEIQKFRPHTNEYFGDFAHLSAKGHATIARIIRDRVKADQAADQDREKRGP